MRRYQRPAFLLILFCALAFVLWPVAEQAHDAVPHAPPWDVPPQSASLLPPGARLAAAAPMASDPTGTGPLPYGTGSFLETFDDFVDPGQPPVPWASNAKWDVMTHSRDNNACCGLSWEYLEPMVASDGNAIHHGDGCESPDTGSADTHHEGGYDAGYHSYDSGGNARGRIGTMPFEDANFLCRDHMMTALFAEGYGLLYSTPTRMLQIPSDGSEAVVRLDISTFRSSSRDWVDIWLTPWASNIAAPFNVGEVDVQGEPRDGFSFRMDSVTYGSDMRSTWTSKRRLNGTSLDGGSPGWALPIVENRFIALGMGCSPTTSSCTNTAAGTSKSRRDTVEIRISETRVKFWMPDYNLVFLDRAHTTPLNADQYVVQFGHHSYNPGKAHSDAGELADDGTPAHANTWHWDNLSLNPATSQFFSVHANERFVGGAPPVRDDGAIAPPTLANSPPTICPCSDTYTFPTAAPANSYFRALIYGAGMEYRPNGTGSWLTLPVQQGTRNPPTHFAHKNYFAPIPEGTTSIQLRQTISVGQGNWGADYGAIWSTTLDSTVPPTFTPTPVGSNTPTPLPTQTPTQTPTATPSPTNTPTPPPTSTPGVDAGSFFDDFATVALDATKWVAGNIYGASSTGTTLQQTGGELRLTPADGVNSRYAGIRSVGNYNLTGQSAYVHAKQVASGADPTGVETVLITGPNASNWIRMVVNNGVLYCQSNTANTTSIHASATYSSNTHAWWRLRETGGSLFCDTAADNDGAPGTWVAFGTRSNPVWPLTGLKIELHVGTWQLTTAPTVAIFDGFNTSDDPSAPGHRPRRGSLTGVE